MEDPRQCQVRSRRELTMRRGDFDNHDQLLFAVVKGVELDTLLVRARHLGWTEASQGELVRFVETYQLLCQCKDDYAAMAAFDELSHSENKYIAYHSEVFHRALEAGFQIEKGQDDSLRDQAESILLGLGGRIGQEPAAAPFDAIAWISVAVRLSMSLSYARVSNLRWERLSAAAIKSLHTIDGSFHHLAVTQELKWLLNVLTRSEDELLAALATRLAKQWKIDLSKEPVLFP